MNTNSKSEKKQKIDFRVKFAGHQPTNNSLASRQMILSVRQRDLRDLSCKSSHAIEQREIEETSSNEIASEVSKQDLQTHTDPTKPFEYSTLNSSNITNNFDIISSFFETQVNFRLIYRASKHDFSVKEFHEICDAYEDTLTLCLTEDNKIIGGFTPLNWEEQFHKGSTHFKTDYKRETFLFSVTDKAKYPLVKSLKNKAICCFKSYGPTFGGGYDLLIGDRCNEIPNATSYFPRNFEHPAGMNYNKRDFTGTSRKNFKLQEWEVFHVIKVHSLKTIEALNFAEPKHEREYHKEPSVWENFKTFVSQLVGALCNDK